MLKQCSFFCFFEGYDATWIGGTTSDGKWIVLALDRRKNYKMSIGYVYLQVCLHFIYNYEVCDIN